MELTPVIEIGEVVGAWNMELAEGKSGNFEL
jgi:hypothetical protein